ncbi:MAG: class I SAM-dependent methyltransferase [Sedimentisphaerales bacterium]
MGTNTAKASVFYRTNAKIRSIAGYGALLARNLNGFLSLDSDSSLNRLEKELNSLLAGYPRNHNYRIHKKKLIPSFKLYERLRLVVSFYPEKLESFLDIGSCRGYYAMEAAQRPNCRISAGADIYEPFISISKKVREYLDIKNVEFYFATLDELSSRPEAYGGPFQIVLLIGTYHYLFWGSKLSPIAYHNHREILARLSQICTDRLIFSARLEIDRLPNDIKQKAKMLGNEVGYNTADFLRSAEEFFEVHKAGYLGKYPLLVMLKKNS